MSRPHKRMEPHSALHGRPLSRGEAEILSPGGLCRDPSHAWPTVLEDCPARKCLKRQPGHASYTVVHHSSLPHLSRPPEEPVVQAAGKGSQVHLSLVQGGGEPEHADRGRGVISAGPLNEAPEAHTHSVDSLDSVPNDDDDGQVSESETGPSSPSQRSTGSGGVDVAEANNDDEEVSDSETESSTSSQWSTGSDGVGAAEDMEQQPVPALPLPVRPWIAPSSDNGAPASVQPPSVDRAQGVGGASPRLEPVRSTLPGTQPLKRSRVGAARIMAWAHARRAYDALLGAEAGGSAVPGGDGEDSDSGWDLIERAEVPVEDTPALETLWEFEMLEVSGPGTGDGDGNWGWTSVS
ncbi:hypothetical protein LTR53_011803 [Teratosphaeriaceae sp. CCFEE 6253]|nr:hypothetical protein LTR53_011803 [Teratosphaeriaceae sp. CCFEE 6253]